MHKHFTPPTRRLALTGVISLLCANALADTAKYAINGDPMASTRSHASLGVQIAGLQPIPNTAIYVWATGSQLGEYCLLAKNYTKGQQTWVPAITHIPNGTILKGQADCADATAKLINMHDPSTFESATNPNGGIDTWNSPFIGVSKKVWPSPDREVFVPIFHDIDLSAPLFDDVKVYVGVVDESGQQKTEYAEVFAVNALPTPPAPIKNTFGTPVSLKTGIAGEPCSVNFGDDSNQGKTQRYAICPETVEHLYRKPDLYTVKIGRSSGMLQTQTVDVNSDSWFAYAYAGEGNLYPTTIAEYIQNGTLHFKPSYPINTPPYSPENVPNEILHTTYGLRRDLPASGDAFSIELRVKNALIPGTTQCALLSTAIFGENDKRIWIRFETTCEVTSDGEFDPTTYHFTPYDAPRTEIQNLVSLKYADNSHSQQIFANNFKDWRIIKIKVASKTIKVFYDGVEVLSSPYINNIGQLKGLSQEFMASHSDSISNLAGSGSVDWVKLYDANDKIVYQEDFN